LLSGAMFALPAYAIPGDEDPMDPCFNLEGESYEGFVSRQLQLDSNSTMSYDSLTWYQSSESTFTNQSGQVFRTNQLKNENNTTTQSFYRDDYFVVYDLENNSKTVYHNTWQFDYFTEVFYIDFVGWLVEGGEVIDYNHSSRVLTRETNRSSIELLTSSEEIIELNCSGFDYQEPGSGEVFEVELNPATAESLLVPTFSAAGIRAAEVTIEAGTFSGAGKLRIWNDQNSVSNRFGYSSLAFQIVGGNGSEVKLLKPMTVRYPEATNSVLAYSTDGGNWTTFGALNSSSIEASSVSSSSASSFELKSLPVGSWIYVGQKAEQAEATVYADRFSLQIGGSAKVTNTGGSGTGLVSYVSVTPEICEVRDEAIVGLNSGNCEVVANKQGFDGYTNKQSQIIRLTVEK
jgi:hypothetical protein